MSGELVAEVQWLKASQSGQRGPGEYYVIPKSTFEAKPDLRGTLVLET